MRIIGIDPGSLRTGFGIIETLPGGRLRHVAHGCLQLGRQPFLERLAQIHQRLRAIVQEFRPDTAAIEAVFLARNADSALKLGQARGAALVALLDAALPVAEYSALQIKKATVGAGHADKTQVEHMVRRLLGIGEGIQADAADALACAICHAHCQGTQNFWAAREIGGR